MYNAELFDFEDFLFKIMPETRSLVPLRLIQLMSLHSDTILSLSFEYQGRKSA